MCSGMRCPFGRDDVAVRIACRQAHATGGSLRITRTDGQISIRDRPTTHVRLDLTRRYVQLVRIGLSGRHVQRISFDDLEVAEVDQGSDSEGGPVWRPAVRLRDGQRVLLSELWSHDQVGVAEGVAVVAAACGLPTPEISGRDGAGRLNI
jgi:hypothetical protein